MLCLHGTPAASSTTENGSFWFCGEYPKCHFICPEEEGYLYDKAIRAFLATNQERPKCCAVDYEERNFAKMFVVKDPQSKNYGRPFFKCPKKNERCEYFEWGDEIIIPKPLCKHGKPSKLRKVKKQGPNQGRTFLCCPEPLWESCKFFRWLDVTKTPNSDVMEENTETPEYSVDRNIYIPEYFTDFSNTETVVKRKKHN